MTRFDDESPLTWEAVSTALGRLRFSEWVDAGEMGVGRPDVVGRADTVKTDGSAPSKSVGWLFASNVKVLSLPLDSVVQKGNIWR